MRRHLLLPVLALGAASSCTSPGTAPREGSAQAAQAPPAAPPLALDEEADIWSYLVERYDRDGDAVVSSEEYTRGSFARLDRNGDGELTAADFSAQETPRQTRMMGAVTGEAMLGWYFQDDEDAERLDAGELERVLRGFDTDDDGNIARDEFECAAEGQAAFGQAPGGEMGRMLRDTLPWEGLTSGIDEDADGTLSDGELFAFFETRDEDGDGVLGFEDESPRGRAATASDSSGAPEGEWAPDFELPLDHGQGTVRLSAMRGERPVALIFGSYT